MKSDFEWLKWVGLTIVLSILGAIYFVNSKNSKHEIEGNQNAQLQADREYEKNLDEAAIAMHETQLEAQYTQDNPPTYPKISLQQTTDFINRIEQLRSSDAQINLEYTPDVTRQSRRYNSFVDQAIAIYGDNDIANPYRDCTNVAWMARELWTQIYSHSSLSQESRENSKKLFLEAYEDAKKGCLEEVVNPSA